MKRFVCVFQGKITRDHKLRGRVERYLELTEQIENRKASNFQICCRYYAAYASHFTQLCHPTHELNYLLYPALWEHVNQILNILQ